MQSLLSRPLSQSSLSCLAKIDLTERYLRNSAAFLHPRSSCERDSKEREPEIQSTNVVADPLLEESDDELNSSGRQELKYSESKMYSNAEEYIEPFEHQTFTSLVQEDEDACKDKDFNEASAESSGIFFHQTQYEYCTAEDEPLQTPDLMVNDPTTNAQSNTSEDYYIEQRLNAVESFDEEDQQIDTNISNNHNNNNNDDNDGDKNHLSNHNLSVNQVLRRDQNGFDNLSKHRLAVSPIPAVSPSVESRSTSRASESTLNCVSSSSFDETDASSRTLLANNETVDSDNYLSDFSSCDNV